MPKYYMRTVLKISAKGVIEHLLQNYGSILGW